MGKMGRRLVRRTGWLLANLGRYFTFGCVGS
jgi:hypothetical protein